MVLRSRKHLVSCQSLACWENTWLVNAANQVNESHLKVKVQIRHQLEAVLLGTPWIPPASSSSSPAVLDSRTVWAEQGTLTGNRDLQIPLEELDALRALHHARRLEQSLLSYRDAGPGGPPSGGHPQELRLESFLV